MYRFALLLLSCAFALGPGCAARSSPSASRAADTYESRIYTTMLKEGTNDMHEWMNPITFGAVAVVPGGWNSGHSPHRIIIRDNAFIVRTTSQAHAELAEYFAPVLAK